MSSEGHNPSRRLVHRLPVLIPLIVLLFSPRAVAQPALPGLPAPAAAKPHAKTPPALSPEEARQMLSLLNDPQERAAFAAALETFSKATAATQPKKPAETSPVPLAPNSIGAEVLAAGSGWITGLSRQFASMGRILGDLPTVWSFTINTIKDPVLRGEALDAAWRLILAFAAAALGEYGAWLLVRRFIRTLAARAPRLEDATARDPSLRPEEEAALRAEILRRENAAVDAETAAEQSAPENSVVATGDASAHPLADREVGEAHPDTPLKAVNGAAPTRPIPQATPSRDGTQRSAENKAARVAPLQDGSARPVVGNPALRDAAAKTLAGDTAFTAVPAAIPPAHVDEAVESALRRRRFSRTLRALKRLPFVLLRLLLELIPLGVFLGIGYSGMLFYKDPRIVAILQAAVLAYAACRAATSLTRMVVSPDEPCLRLVHISDEGASYTLTWVRRIFAVAAFGFAASQIGLLFGLPFGATDAFMKADFLVVHLFLIIIVLQCRKSVAARIRSHREKPTLTGTIRNRIAAFWHLVAIFYIAGLWLVWAASIRHGYLRIWHVFLVSAGVIIAVRLCAIVVLGALDRAFRVPPDLKKRYPGLETRANHYYPLLRATVSLILTVIGGLALLEAWGVDSLAWFNSNALGGKLLSAAITILIAGILALALWEGVNASIDRHLAHLTRDAQAMKAARLRTLQPMLRTMLLVALIAVFGLTALSEIGVNIAPLLAGAGIVGVAIGFGSQKLVQDFITGIFLLLENAMQVGDWVTVAGLSGSVENLSIRTMRLRAGDGSVHIIPFSSVSTVTNVNRGIGNAAVVVTIPVEEDSDRVSGLLADIAAEMRGERRFADMMRSDLQLWGVDKVEGGLVTIAGQIVCTDGGRWAVQREFNRRMMIRLKQERIRFGTPVTTVYNHMLREAPMPAQQIAKAGSPHQMEESPPPAAIGNTT